VGQALGTVAAQELRSPAAVPPFANSAMDGYAVRSADCAAPGAELRVVGEVPAGALPGPELGERRCVRIMTGAPLPLGADAVCPWEQAQARGEWVCIEPTVTPGAHVRSAGEDVALGDVLVVAGEELTPVHIGLLEAVGQDQVGVIPKPRVAVLSTGDELSASTDLEPGKIRDANRAVLLGLLVADGYDSVDLGVVKDDPEALRRAWRRAADDGCTALCSTGGVSFGDRDVVRAALSSATTRVCHPMEVAIKPGKPQVFAVLEDPALAVFALPGNPVAAVVGWELFVRPGLRAMAGRRDLLRPEVGAVAGAEFARRRDGKLHVVPARFAAAEPRTVVPAGRFGSHLLSTLRQVDAFALLPDGDTVPCGATVRCLVLRPERALVPAGP
jgi:molybdopterin molybdotransferase